MAVLANITQQPQDVRDYDIDFSEWFPAGDIVTTADVTVDKVGLTVTRAVQHPRVKVWVRGGVAGTTYKITVVAGTNDGRAKEVELKVRIKDY